MRDPTATRISTEKVLRLPVTSPNQGAARGAGKVHEAPGVGQEGVAMQRTPTIPGDSRHHRPGEAQGVRLREAVIRKYHAVLESGNGSGRAGADTRNICGSWTPTLHTVGDREVVL